MSAAPGAASIEAYATHDEIDGVPQPFVTPQLFGHGQAFGEMLEARRSGRMHHAWLLQGPAGIGKATAAFCFARLLSGAATREEPEATIGFRSDDPVFRQIAIGSLPGLIHVTRPPVERGTGFRTQITVEEVRRLGRFFHATASGEGWRIAIVDPADDLNRSAANALLKLLEEPPARSLFLLVNHTPGRLLPTIRSRCRLARFEELSGDELTRVLAAFGHPLDPDDAGTIVRAAEGSVRRALMLAANGGVEIGRTLETLLSAGELDVNGLQALLDQLTGRGREASFELFLSLLLDRVARESHRRLEGADIGAAAAFAELWQAESRRLGEGAAFNLDRKQMAMTTASRYFALKAALERRRSRDEALALGD
ncbi:DNA polymerase III subunit delta' [Jiella sonneratiae]|uniref:DNA polymerase III subunit delta n=1 Tax=Jiella sonneratiae TaxID=2816856 RepID=A0ABS3IX71_9HYPH|nr:DNA polymerase III subunit delta' [Jiella sonneratiae]MBO0902016.1 DNA polymerase III subunit delta' [Jiella sonneratiae]